MGSWILSFPNCLLLQIPRHHPLRVQIHSISLSSILLQFLYGWMTRGNLKFQWMRLKPSIYASHTETVTTTTWFPETGTTTTRFPSCFTISFCLFAFLLPPPPWTTPTLSLLFLVKLLLIFKTTISIFNSAKTISKIIAEAFQDAFLNFNEISSSPNFSNICYLCSYFAKLML